MSLHALNPLDGRYEKETAPLQKYFSEFSYLQTRTHLELDFISALSKSGICPPLETSARDFSDTDALKIQEYEKTTQHDVKAIEYFLREKLPAKFHPWIHFGLTSEDINNIATAIALKESRDRILLPTLDDVVASLRDFARKYRALPILARTHGQPAVPTTLGKEIAVFLFRLLKCRTELASHIFDAKLSGAVGNFNSLKAAAPQIDWLSFSEDFIKSAGLQPNLVTTQILPYDNWLGYFQSLKLTNSILIGYTQDIWQYLCLGILRQTFDEGQIGSSTMPQKVNPIAFENAEGNLGIANALLAHQEQKLPVSRLQRDLSDSTVRRTFGVALAHTLLAWKNIAGGMAQVEADEERIRLELNEHWEVLTEGVQTILRAADQGAAYETMQGQVQGRVMSETDFKSGLESLEVDEETRHQLRALAPDNYLGYATEITDRVIRESEAG